LRRSLPVNALDFIVLFTMPGPTGEPTLVHLRRWRYQDILVRPGQANPGSGSTLSVSALAGDLPALVERVRAHGGGTVEGPLDTPWNTRDVRLTDPDGYRVIYTARRARGGAGRGVRRENPAAHPGTVGRRLTDSVMAHGSAVARGEDSLTPPKRWCLSMVTPRR
jgi:hypothetical protein